MKMPPIKINIDYRKLEQQVLRLIPPLGEPVFKASRRYKLPGKKPECPICEKMNSKLDKKLEKLGDKTNAYLFYNFRI